MKKMKKMTAIICSATLLLTGASALVSCGEEETPEKTVMNVSCNPEVEFVLDDENKVVSANALNEEGNLVLNGEVFVGLSAEEAGKLFVSVSVDMGFIVESKVQITENEISVSFTGDATELYNSVKSQIDVYLTEENITATITQGAAITKQYLQDMVAQCAPYLEAAEIAKMDRAELVEVIYESRKETAEYYSQELKNAYYEAKAFILEQAEVEALKGQMNAIAQAALQTTYDAYSAAVAKIEEVRTAQFLAADSDYQVKLAAFREKKIEFLQYREEVAQMEENEFTPAIEAMLDGYELAVNTAEELYVAAGNAANGLLDTAKATAKSAYDAVVGVIETFVTRTDKVLSEISTKQQAAKEQFFLDFETSYAAAIAKAESDWAAMKATLENKDTAVA